MLRARQEVREEPVVSGLLEAPEIRLGSRVGGRVRAVKAREGDAVSAGQLLVELSAPDLVAKLDEARAQVPVVEAALRRAQEGFRAEEIAQARSARDAAKAALAEAQAGSRSQELEQARQAVTLARAQLDLARTTHARNAALFGKGAVSAEQVDRAREQLEVAGATVRAREAELALLKEGTRPERLQAGRAQLAEAQALLDLRERGYRPEDVAEAKARVEVARRAAVTLAEQVRELEIRAPMAGRLDALDLEPGDLVTAGVPALTVIGGDRLWLRAYTPQKYLSVVRPGAMLAVTFDAIPGKRYQGKVSFVATQAEFTPSNVQTPEERGRQVFRFKVDVPPSPELHPGMTGDVHLGAAP